MGGSAKAINTARRPPREPRLPSGPTVKTRESIAATVRLRVYQGKTVDEIADAMQVTVSMIREWRTKYAALWTSAEEALTQEVVELVRSTASTDAVLEDPDAHFARAKLADKWVEARGESLFPVDDEPTLVSFYKSYYFPVCLSGAMQSTKDYHQIILRRWRLITGDPPLKSITTELLARFRDTLRQSRGRRSCERMRDATVASNLRFVQTLLDKAGPPGPRNRDAAEIIARAPWVRPPKVELQTPRSVSFEFIDAAYTAAIGMGRPRIAQMKPSRWWQALIAVTYNTGLRRGTLFRLRWDWVCWKQRTIIVPAHSMKSKRLHVTPLNGAALNHLRMIRKDEEELVFRWPYDRRYFQTVWHELLDLAGIPRGEHFGLHDLRRTLATNLWKTNPEAAQLALGHTNAAVTIDHYINQSGIVAAAVDKLQQPAAFLSAV